MSPKSFVLSIASPALICQVDEHTFDQLVVTSDGTVITRHVHGAVLVCVKTAAILGAVLSLDSLKEEDYMRLVKMALEPKDRITALYECSHRWPCSGKPAVIFHDRGKIFTSERATQVLVDRLGITTEQAPPYAPSAKGTVEALFTWVTRKFTHRLPGTTKATPADRGTYASAREAEKAGMTLDVLEKLFIQAIVDAYLQEWDHLRRGRRIALWEDSVREKGVPRYLGSPDDLKLLLMKAKNRKNPVTGRYAITPARTLLSWEYRYVSPGLLGSVPWQGDRYLLRSARYFGDLPLCRRRAEGRSVLYRVAWTAAEHLGSAGKTEGRCRASQRREHDQLWRIVSVFSKKPHLAEKLSRWKPDDWKSSACWTNNVQRFTPSVSRRPYRFWPSSTPPSTTALPTNRASATSAP